VCRCGLGGGKHTIQVRFRIAEGNIAGDRFIKHVVLLKYYADVPTHIAIIQCL
jgi:hypothetical protein